MLCISMNFLKNAHINVYFMVYSFAIDCPTPLECRHRSALSTLIWDSVGLAIDLYRGDD